MLEKSNAAKTFVEDDIYYCSCLKKSTWNKLSDYRVITIILIGRSRYELCIINITEDQVLHYNKVPKIMKTYSVHK